MFLPIFVGAGKEHCFVTKRCAKRVLDKTQKTIDALVNRSDISDFMLVYGEPDTRWLLGKGWHPWKRRFANPLIVWRRDALLKQSLDRFMQVVDSLRVDKQRLIIYANTSVYCADQIKYAKRWNAAIENYCSARGIRFLNILDEITVGDRVAEEYVADIVHAGPAIVPLVKGKLGLDATEASDQKSRDMNRETLPSMFKFNAKFDCYTLAGMH